MKLITAIIQPSRLEAVKELLATVDVTRLTVSDVQGFGRQMGNKENFIGKDYPVMLLRKVKLEIGVNEAFVKPTIDAILKAARSENGGAIGDGKIFIQDLPEVIRIRTGERGGTAI